MTDRGVDWRKELAGWLNSNPKTMPAALEECRQQFTERFPKERLGDLTLDGFVAGNQSKDTFCYWLEWRTRKLGSISGGSAAKFGVWWSKKDGAYRCNSAYSSAEDAIVRIKQGLLAAVKAVEAGNLDERLVQASKMIGPNLYVLRSKPLYLYFPNQFLPIASQQHLKRFLEFFGAAPDGDVLECNRRLLGLVQQLPEFEGLDTQQIGNFLYGPIRSLVLKRDGPKQPRGTCAESNDILPAGLAPETEVLRLVVSHTKNAILYGPPGTGKTWLAKRFADDVIGTQPGSAASASNRYWWAIGDGEYWRRLAEERETLFVTNWMPDNYRAARCGDLVFCYEKSPALKLQGLARVAEEYRAAGNGHGEGGVTLEHVLTLPHPIGWHAIKEDRVLQNSQPVTHNGQSSLLRLQAPQTAHLLDMVRAAGNSVDLDHVEQPSYVEFVTFHQSFAYEDFVEGIRPTTDEGGRIRYEVHDGIFKRVCRRAQADPEHKYLLIIDEINRANIAKVLGELITLIEDDKRLRQTNEVVATLPYSGDRFGVPPNLYILGTMNTADRSIALLDLALRRRFAFVECMPRPDLLPQDVGGVNLRDLLIRLNQRITALLGRDYQIGHSYLMHVKDANDLQFAWYYRVVPLLQEYCYNDGRRLREILGRDFVVPIAQESGTSAVGDAEAMRYEVKRLPSDQLASALQALASAASDDVPAYDDGEVHGNLL